MKSRTEDGSELRRDMVSGDWILVAAKRAKRPQAERTREKIPSLKSGCPFDDPQKGGTGEPLLWLAHPEAGKKGPASFSDWWVQIIPNKYPALSPHHVCPEEVSDGPYFKMAGTGFHEVIITRDHDRRISEMNVQEVAVLLEAYQERYKVISKEPCIEYTLIFHNQGPEAGASIYHPHSQLIALPIIPPDVRKSLEGSRQYYVQKGKCVHCAMLEWELAQKERVVFENEGFAVFEPYASRVSYETRIFPKKHSARFEEMDSFLRAELAEALQKTLGKIKNGMGDPDYNFFIHTAPAQPDGIDYYHWHVEIPTKTAIWAGLELGTGVEVIAISPEEAAL